MLTRVSLASILCAVLAPSFSLAEAVSDQAAEIIRATGVRGGLVVHVGCGDGQLTAALRTGDSYLVHGLDCSAEGVTKARQHVHSLGIYGPVSVEAFDGEHLPYADNLVNLLVSEDLGQLGMVEVLRVLAPFGVAYVKQDGEWTKTVKLWPDDIDEWTHFLHDASNNAVAQDTRLGPPRQLKWKCGPLWSRSHEFTSSVAAMISAGGRVFYVVDEGLTSLTDERLPERWMLIGRDAFNGVLLWKRPLANWRGDSWKNNSLRGRPASVPRRIVSDGRQLYATLSHHGPLEILDPATGKTVRKVDGTDNTQEIVLAGNSLVLRSAAVATRRGEPHGSIVSVDTDSGQVSWRIGASQYLPQSLAAADGRVVYSDGQQTVCLSLTEGNLLWRQSTTPGKGKRPGEQTVILHSDLVLEGNGGKIVARSAVTGQTLWTAATSGGSMRGMDLFVAQGLVWHAASGGIAGYDLKTGKPTTTIDPSCVQSAGHHLRCYRAKATERFLITQFRGAEFISLTDSNHVNNDWIRGPCRYGVMPANGLLYVPPNPCFCYPGAKLTGFLALAPKDSRIQGREPRADERLDRGPAYADIPHFAVPTPHSTDWPTYRHDAARKGATACEVSAKVSPSWELNLGGTLTPPVVCGNRVYVAAKDQHTLHAIDADEGSQLWQFTARGRIDSPPTVDGNLVLFGCADGWVYCVGAVDGQLAWRFRAAPTDRRIVSFSQLESPWRVHGSVLLEGGVAYCTAGRSTFLDGGIWIFGLDPQTGRVVHEAQLDTWAPIREDPAGKPFIPSYHIEGTHSDILVAQDESIYLGQYQFDRALAVQDAPYVMRDPDKPIAAMDISKEGYTAQDPDLSKGFEYYRSFHRYMEKAHPELARQYKQKYGGMNMGDRRTGMHLSATAGFLDDTWFNRTFWMYSAKWPGWYHAHRGAKSGQLLVIGPDKTYALQAFPTRNRQSPLFTPGDKGYLLIADDNRNEPVLDDMTRGATKGMGYTRLDPPTWYQWVPVRVRAMVLAAGHLFIAGPPDVVTADDGMASFEGRKGGLLWTLSAETGKRLAEHKLDSPPVFDGLIAARGRLFFATLDGRIVCMGDDHK